MERSLKELIRLAVSEELKDHSLRPTPERVKWMYANMLFKTKDHDMTQALVDLLKER